MRTRDPRDASESTRGAAVSRPPLAWCVFAALVLAMGVGIPTLDAQSARVEVSATVVEGVGAWVSVGGGASATGTLEFRGRSARSVHVARGTLFPDALCQADGAEERAGITLLLPARAGEEAESGAVEFRATPRDQPGSTELGLRPAPPSGTVCEEGVTLVVSLTST